MSAANVQAAVPTAPEAEPLPDAHQAVRQLAMLPEHEYEQRREEEAKRLNVRVSRLDRWVRDLRAETAKAEAGSPEVVETLEPWPSPVDAQAVAEDVRRSLFAHVVFPSEADADAATVWILGTYLMDAWRLWPKLLVQSPEKRCGKTTFLEVVEAHVFRGLMTASITGAALFRSIEKWSPTLLIEEADRFPSRPRSGVHEVH